MTLADLWHALVSAWPVLSAVLIVVVRTRTPEQWVALGEHSPRLQGAVRLLRALGLDPVRALDALAVIVTGRVRQDPRAAKVLALEAELAALRGPVESVPTTRPPSVPPPVVGAALVCLLALSACSAARRTVTDVTPTAPQALCAVEGAARCNADVPETCGLADGALRWWPSTPLASDGRPARCAGVCVLSMDGTASWCSAGSASSGNSDGGAP